MRRNKYNLNKIAADDKCERIQNILGMNNTRIPYLVCE
jgi:hypothetical protein